jgi:hypothetical protein
MRAFVLLVGFATLLLVLPPVVSATSPPRDDLFGLDYSPYGGHQTSFVPANTQGLYLYYAISTTGITCTSSSGWVLVVDTLSIAGGSPKNATLQATIGFSCTGSGTSQWNIQYGWYNNSGKWNGLFLIASLSTSTYSSLSGTVKIYYIGSCWTEVTYVSQVSKSYSPPNGGCYPSIQGTKADGSNNDWMDVETDYQQSGINFGSTFQWTINTPEFYVGGVWQNWNWGPSNYKYLSGYAVVNSNLNRNNLGVTFLSSPGVDVQVGQSASDGQEHDWCVVGHCLSPSS